MSQISDYEYEDLIKKLEMDVVSGDIQSMKWLGDVYYQGSQAHPSDLKRAMDYWKMAADRGEPLSQGKVGLSYMTGNILPKNERLGLEYLEKAAVAGQVQPQRFAGMAYLYGTGCTKNLKNAEKYLRMAALNNDSEAQYQLGYNMLIQEIPNINDECGHWLCCAHLNGNTNATKLLNDMMSKGYKREWIDDAIQYIRENGVIPPKIEFSGNNSGQSEGCYIATAVYGSYDAPEVKILRRFRDEVLKQSVAGRLFIKIYYRFSPRMADKLKYKRKINILVKRILDRYVKRLSKEESFYK